MISHLDDTHLNGTKLHEQNLACSGAEAWCQGPESSHTSWRRLISLKARRGKRLNQRSFDSLRAWTRPPILKLKSPRCGRVRREATEPTTPIVASSSIGPTIALQLPHRYILPSTTPTRSHEEIVRRHWQHCGAERAGSRALALCDAHSCDHRALARCETPSHRNCKSMSEVAIVLRCSKCPPRTRAPPRTHCPGHSSPFSCSTCCPRTPAHQAQPSSPLQATLAGAPPADA